MRSSDEGFSIALGGALLVSLVFLIGFGRITLAFLDNSPELAWWVLAGLASLFVVRSFFENAYGRWRRYPVHHSSVQSQACSWWRS